MYRGGRLEVRYSPARRAVYRLLLASPHARWSVASMIEALPAETRSAEAVRATLYVLADVRILAIEQEGSRLLFRLAESGAVRLRCILDTWPR